MTNPGRVLRIATLNSLLLSVLGAYNIVIAEYWPCRNNTALKNQDSGT